MIFQHVRYTCLITALYALAIPLDSLETSLSINGVFDQVLPDCAWSVILALLSLWLWMAFARHHLKQTEAALLLLSMVWIFFTIPRIIHFLPASVLYGFVSLMCIRTYILADKVIP